MTRAPLFASIAAGAAAIAGYGALYLSRAHGHALYALDDAYIGFATAKNLAVHGVWGATRYEFSGSSTSLLWPLLLAGSERAIGWRSLTPFLLNAAAAIAAIAVVDRWLPREIPGRWTRAAVALLVMTAAAMPALAVVGMEHTIQCLLALVVAFAGVRLAAAPPGTSQRTLTAIVAVASALAIATRYDTLSVVAPVILLLLWSRRGAAAVIVAVSAAVPPAVYALVAQRHGWPLVPVAILEKSPLPPFAPTFAFVVAAIRSACLTAIDARALTALLIAAIVLWFTTRRDAAPSRQPRLLLLVFILAAALHLQFGRAGWPGRYQAYVIALGVAAVAAALPLGARRRGVSAAISWTAAAIALCYVARHAVIVHLLFAGAGDGQLRHEYLQARFLQRHPQPGSVMLVDLGAPAFFSDARIVDLSGLANADVARIEIRGALTRDMIRALAATHDVHALIDVDAADLPDEWIHVADWVSPNVNATFVAVDAASAQRLLADLRDFQPELPAGVGLRADMRTLLTSRNR